MAAVLPGQPSITVRAEHAVLQDDVTQDGYKQLHGWSPYQDNGGTSLAIAGKDFAVVAADTRMSNGYSIMDRDTSKCCELPGNTVLASSGMMADRNHLHKMLSHRFQWYEYKNKKVASLTCIRQTITNTLYSRRMFPLYTYNVLAGVDADGSGHVYSYDVVGCTERRLAVSTGSGAHLVEPILDSALKRYNQAGKGPNTEITVEEAVDLAKDALTSAAEREIETGM